MCVKAIPAFSESAIAHIQQAAVRGMEAALDKENSCGNLRTPSKATPAKGDEGHHQDSANPSPSTLVTDNPAFNLASPTKSPFQSLRKDATALAAQLAELQAQLAEQPAPVTLVIQVVEEAPEGDMAAAAGEASEGGQGSGDAVQQLQRSEALVADLSAQAGQLKGRIAKVRPTLLTAAPRFQEIVASCKFFHSPRSSIKSPRRAALQLEGAVAAGEAKVRAQAGELESLKAANRELDAALQQASALVGVTPDRTRAMLRELQDKAERWVWPRALQLPMVLIVTLPWETKAEGCSAGCPVQG